MIKDIFCLKPGIEMDKLIAEKVLGWYQDSDVGGPRDWWFKKGSEEALCEEALYLNCFSTDIKAAWDLAMQFRLYVIPFGRDGWTAFVGPDYFMGEPKNAATTAPHAICLAVLHMYESSVMRVRWQATKVLASATDRKLPTDNIKIFLLPSVADALGLGESLSVEYKGRKWNIPIVRDATIFEGQLENGAFTSDIKIGDPDLDGETDDIAGDE